MRKDSHFTMYLSKRQLKFLTALAIAAGTTGQGSAVADEISSLGLEPTVVSAPGRLVSSNYYAYDDSSETAAEKAASAEPESTAAPVAESVVADEIVAAPCNCCSTPCCTKKKAEAAMANMKGAYKGVFYANDFSYLDDSCYKGAPRLGDSLKGLWGGKLDIGGEARIRYHSENNNRNFKTGADDQFWLTRYRLFANLRINDYFRFYGEALYADSAGETFAPRGIEVNRGEAQNLFVDVKLTESLTARAGRQEILLGAQRLISPLDWANTRRTFDGYRMTYKADDTTIDGFYLNPVTRRFDDWDSTNEGVDFYGVYAAKAGTAVGNLETYYIGLDNQAADFSYHTLGSRVNGTADSGTLYEFEGGVQFGENSPGFGSHSAAFFTGGLGRQLDLCVGGSSWKPTVWMWYDWASGGDDVPGARGDDSFDHGFPLAHKYLGFMDLFARRNINDVNFQFITPISKKVKLLVWYHYFFLDQKTTPYNVGGNPISGVAAGDRELGSEIDLALNVNLDARNSALIGYSHFNSGKYYSTTVDPGNVSDIDADFFYVQYQTRF